MHENKKQIFISKTAHKALCFDKEAWSNSQMAYYIINTFFWRQACIRVTNIYVYLLTSLNSSQNNLSTIYSNNLKSSVKLIFSATTCKWTTILQGNQSSTQKFTAVLSVHMLCSAGSRPWDKGGVSKKIFFRAFGPQFGLKLRRAGPRAPPLDPPLRWSEDLHLFGRI